MIRVKRHARLVEIPPAVVRKQPFAKALWPGEDHVPELVAANRHPAIAEEKFFDVLRIHGAANLSASCAQTQPRFLHAFQLMSRVNRSEDASEAVNIAITCWPIKTSQRKAQIPAATFSMLIIPSPQNTSIPLSLFIKFVRTPLTDVPAHVV
jgi:hypothetical protein